MTNLINELTKLAESLSDCPAGETVLEAIAALSPPTLEIGTDIIVYGRADYDEPVHFADSLTVKRIIQDEHGKVYECELRFNGILPKGHKVLVDPTCSLGKYPSDSLYPQYGTKVVVVPKPTGEQRYMYARGNHFWASNVHSDVHFPINTSHEADQPGWKYLGTDVTLEKNDLLWNCITNTWEYAHLGE